MRLPWFANQGTCASSTYRTRGDLATNWAANRNLFVFVKLILSFFKQSFLPD